MRRLVITFFVITTSNLSFGQESAQYLQSAIRDLRNHNGRQTNLKRVDPGIIPEIPPAHHSPAFIPESAQVSEKRTKSNVETIVPPLSLTKGELAALYKAAVSKGETVNLKSPDNTYIQAAIHELDDSSSYTQANKISTDEHGDSSSKYHTNAGSYYYYYYPIKSFLDEMTSQSSPEKHYTPSTNHYDHHDYHDYHDHHEDHEKPHFQYHSHTHQHNVKITKDVTEKKDKKGLEPLFMAISGFIGMAVMFVVSMLILPKFGIKKPIIKKSDAINDIARVALQAIEGKDCTERFACELEKTARTFNVQDNRFVKLFKRMAPSFGKQMDKIGKYGMKRLRCTAIPCKKKNPAPKKKVNISVQKKH